MITIESITAAYESVRLNWVMWVIYMVAVAVVSRDDVLRGVGTFCSLFTGAYFIHRFSHHYKNFFTILHHYHHENDNWFAYLSQIMIEILFGIFTLPASYLGYAAHPWVVLLFVLVYSSVHNLNYGILKVNDVHSRHHANVFENIGPDFCDILFGTKHDDCEETSHYIPNIVAAFLFTLVMQRLDPIRPIHLKVAGVLGIIFYLCASWYVWTRSGSKGLKYSAEKRKQGRKKGRKQKALDARKSRRVPVRQQKASPFCEESLVPLPVD
jgi:hypothetical protein